MAKFLAIIICALAIFSMTACGTPSNDTETDRADTPDIINPISECDTLEGAAKIAGFDITAPEAIGDYKIDTITAMEADMIQIDYKDSAGNTFTVRKGIGTDDISGDFSVYTEEKEADVNGNTVTLKFDDDGLVHVAIWNDGSDYSYSVTANGLIDNEVTSIISEIQ